MFAVQVGLSGAAAKRQGKALAKMRAGLVRDQQRAELARLRTLITAARKRRREALQRAKASCRTLRLRVREQVRALRKAELAALAKRGREMRLRARAQCQARRHRIQQAGGNAAERARGRVTEAARLQAQLQRLEHAAASKRARLVSRHERAQESDEAVATNLPADLRAVWQRVKRTIKPGPRTTRTEAFLEWAESHSEEVLAMQSNDADREVRQLVRDYERAERQRHQPRKASADERKALEAIGLSPNRAVARRRAAAIGWEDPPF